jgi:hypothetical protein
MADFTAAVMVSRKLNFLLLKELRQDNATAASKRPLFEKSGAKTFVMLGHGRYR